MQVEELGDQTLFHARQTFFQILCVTIFLQIFVDNFLNVVLFREWRGVGSESADVRSEIFFFSQISKILRPFHPSLHN